MATKLDGDLNVSVNQFQPGELVDVIGRSKGKGFQGVMKKHNLRRPGRFPRFQDAPPQRRHRQPLHPGRIWKNMGMPGHMGDERVTVQNLRIVQVRPEENVILVSGAVPGANGSYVVVRPAKKETGGRGRES